MLGADASRALIPGTVVNDDAEGASTRAESGASRRQRARPSPSVLKLTSPPVEPWAKSAEIAASAALLRSASRAFAKAARGCCLPPGLRPLARSLSASRAR
eukprot:5417179-Pleurochrysis_carterae.AAC.1